ncbi:TadE/TadG family type IV pilus assembly protein [Sphingomonas segetis]|jgi:Flp pilus assembly protein TadG|uniref:TadE/TadG family type IV pilus assembly protein n=1 Tax=Sphingomonas segetis TaxID=1104779 RepID=UPI0012D343E2|nr:TadE/TadG family type IV pilus assembly protein [Sphingomonas segetis]
MRTFRELLRDNRGAAAAEMVLVIPFLLALMMGSVELGNYFYNEHKLVKSVRDGARYAARQRFSNYTDCTGEVPTRDTADTVFENTELVVRKGSLDPAAQDLLPNWDSANFSATMTCLSELDDGSGGNYAFGGLYANVQAPTVLVTVTLPYRSVIGTAFGFSGLGLNLYAAQSAAVMGF